MSDLEEQYRDIIGRLSSSLEAANSLIRMHNSTIETLRTSLSAAQARHKSMVITCECERGPREVIENTDEAGVNSWVLASHCSDCFEDGSAIVYAANARLQKEHPMTPTLPADLISANAVLDFIETQKALTDDPGSYACNRAFEALRVVADEIRSGSFTPAVHSADGLLEELKMIEEIAQGKHDGDHVAKRSRQSHRLNKISGHARAAIANTRHQGAGWMPIETAPEPSTESFLVGRHEDSGIPAVAQVTRTDDECFVCLGIGKFVNPTHWQPLPTAPGQSPAPDEVGK